MKLNLHSDDQIVDNEALTSGKSVYDMKKTTSDETDLSYRKRSSDLHLQESARKKIYIRLALFLTSLSILVAGRLSIPLVKPDCAVDKLQDVFQGVTDFILSNPALRNVLQIITSLFMDGMFLATGAYWVLRGTTSRMFVSVMGFYITRALIQAIWVSPFPAQYWWNSPGLESLVVPYGEGSDFFFSGHVGAAVLCALEWDKNGFPKVAKAIGIGAVYTGFILLVYHVHYSIDLFTGAFFAHWMFMMVDKRKETFDRFFIGIYYNARRFMEKSFRKQEEHELEALKEERR